jgi:diketogulonate reductase-like aldo/keto reductase
MGAEIWTRLLVLLTYEPLQQGCKVVSRDLSFVNKNYGKDLKRVSLRWHCAKGISC